jgi:hypothetical protein
VKKGIKTDNWNYFNKSQKKLRITGLYMRTAEAVRTTKNPSRAAPFVGFFSATFWPAANLTVCFIGGPKRHIQPERYAQCALKIVLKLWN